MSQREIKHYDVIQKTINKEINGKEASLLLNLSTRQIRRLKAKVRKRGIEGLLHGNRAKESNRKIPEKEKVKIIKIIKEKYSDFEPLLASEKLEKYHKIKRSKETIRNIMITEEIWKPKRKKKQKHREWRQRKANYGEMIQYDGSYEYWFEDRGPKCCLLGAIDDASGKVWLKFDEHEGVKPTFNFWREYIEKFGKPFSIYVDKFSTYSMNHKLAKENPDTLTQFERAMEKGLNIEVINAHSPQAKGRIERLFKTLQDRLIKELRLKNISTAVEANKFLEEEFILEFDEKFMVEARSKANLHKKLTKQESSNLDSIFSRQYEKTVMNDFTVSHNKTCYQLTKDQSVIVCKRDKITVEERMDDTIQFKLRGRYLNYKVLPEKPKKIRENKNNVDWVIPATKAHIPAKDHSWENIAYLNNLKKQ